MRYVSSSINMIMLYHILSHGIFRDLQGSHCESYKVCNKDITSDYETFEVGFSSGFVADLLKVQLFAEPDD